MTEGKTALDRLDEIAARADSSDVPLLVAALKDVLGMEPDKMLNGGRANPWCQGYNAALDDVRAIIERRLSSC